MTTGVVLATRNDVAAALVAAQSWRAVTGESTIIAVDHPDIVSALDGVAPGIELRSWVQASTEPGETGALLAAIVAEQPDGTVVVVLPAAALVLGVPEALMAGAARGVAAAITVTTTERPFDGTRPTAEDVLGRGARHQGLMALTAGDPEALRFVRWLDGADPATRDALLPVRTVAVDDPGVGVAWWNLHERPLSWDGDRLLAAGVPVSIVDFEGWQPLHAHMLHPDMTRLLASGDPALRRLVADYAALRAAVGKRLADVDLTTWPDDPVLEGLLADRRPDERRAALRGDPGAREAFLAWAGESDDEDTVWGLNRYLLGLRRARYDLQAAFPDINDRTGVAAYLAWARQADGDVPRVPERFAGPVPFVDDEMRDADVQRDGCAGVSVIGMFDEPGLGIAEIARQVLAGLEASGLPVERVTVDRRGRPNPREGSAPLRHRLTVTCVNGDLLPVVRHRLRHRVRDDARHIAVWWWELQSPPEWDEAMELVDELWAGTRFVADAFAERFHGPVRVVPLGLGILHPPGRLPAAIAGDARPYALVVFDYASLIERKNPVGAIRAFAAADLGPGVRLVVKSVNGDRWPREAERLRLAALDAEGVDVELLDERLPVPEQSALVQGAAAHVALHRSEGLGLTIAEAMLRGIPVIATDYGGSTDLLDASTGWPVAWTLGRVPPGCDPYPAGAGWAEPDVADAARALREVLADGPGPCADGGAGSGGRDIAGTGSGGRAAAVADRVAAARRVAEGRAARIANGSDLGDAARAAFDVMRLEDAGPGGVRSQIRSLRARVGRGSPR